MPVYQEKVDEVLQEYELLEKNFDQLIKEVQTLDS